VRIPALAIELNGKWGVERAIRILLVMMRPDGICSMKEIGRTRTTSDVLGALGTVGLEKKI
jgi:hypothetical protein